MRPLVKWPGGKSREFKKISDIIPADTNTYIEPFFGGGGIYFNLAPARAVINDINKTVMAFYAYVRDNDQAFANTITHIANDWDTLSTIAGIVFNDTRKYKGNIDEKAIRGEIVKISNIGTLPALINGQKHYWELLSDGLVCKLRRVVELERRSGLFSDKDFYDQIAAVTKGAYYYYIRDMFTPASKQEEVAQFIFLREYCFGSMFRFNGDGKFNIPYGGASYNEKSLHAKMRYAYSPSVVNLLRNTEIMCSDFRAFFSRISDTINEKDFCFFDPPYDTEFSEYDKQVFGKADHEALAAVFGGLKCRGLIIIKKTEFIWEIYKNQQKKNRNITIAEYGKNYTYNVRGRNERDVTHLLITNYTPTKQQC